jgi:hypothetical protein
MVASTSVPVLTVTVFDLSCMVTDSNCVRSSCWATRSLRNLTKAVRSGVASFAEKPQYRRKEARSSRASANYTWDRLNQIDSSNALNMASGGQAGWPLAAGKNGSRSTATGLQSIRDARQSKSSDEIARSRSANPNRSWPIERRAIRCSPLGKP